ncbi:MAG TPA: substrate-binding domain-containing protein [Polyangia bacterium]|jgi:D-xylose transport system substrate-binding protein|nr:substrate-binding domain-containing protein [Polyangia bacterium]
MKKSSKPFIACVVSVALIGAFAWCPVARAAGGCTPGKTKRIAFMLKQQTAFRYLHADVPFFQKTVEAAGFKVVFQSAENDPNTQVSQAENVITRGVDAIVIQPVDFNVAGTIAKMATKAGIPVASYDDVIMNAKHAFFIGRDPKEGGIAAAKAVVAAVPKGNYALIGGDPGQTGSTKMQEGYREVLQPLVKKGDIKVVLDQFTPKWKTEPAQAHAENALTRNGNAISAFLVSYDGMSLGVLQAVNGAGLKPGSIPITGQDMELSAAQAIVEGKMFGTLWPAPDEMAVRAAKVAISLAKCETPKAEATMNNGTGEVPWAKTPIYLVTAKDMPAFVCAHQFWLKPDDVYKNVPAKKPSCK